MPDGWQGMCVRAKRSGTPVIQGSKRAGDRSRLVLELRPPASNANAAQDSSRVSDQVASPELPRRLPGQPIDRVAAAWANRGIPLGQREATRGGRPRQGSIMAACDPAGPVLLAVTGTPQGQGLRGKVVLCLQSRRERQERAFLSPFWPYPARAFRNLEVVGKLGQCHSDRWCEHPDRVAAPGWTLSTV